MIDDYGVQFAPKWSNSISQYNIKKEFLQIQYIKTSPTPLNHRHIMYYWESNTEDSSNYNIDYQPMNLNQQYRDLMEMNFAFLSSSLPERDLQLSEEDFKEGFFQNMGRLASYGRQIFEARHKHPNPANGQSTPRSNRLMSHREESRQELHADVDPHPKSQKSHTQPLPQARDREKHKKQRGGKKGKEADKPPSTPQHISRQQRARKTTTMGKYRVPQQPFSSINSRGLQYETSERKSGNPQQRASRWVQMFSDYKYVTPFSYKSSKNKKYRKTPARPNRINQGKIGLLDISLRNKFKKSKQPKKKSQSPPGGKPQKSKSEKRAKGGDSRSKKKSKKSGKEGKPRNPIHNAGVRSRPKSLK